MKALFLMVILSAVSARNKLLEQELPVDRQLFLTLDRNQKFYRQEDRARCEFISPGRDEPHHE